jgi:hypothetical protein
MYYVNWNTPVAQFPAKIQSNDRAAVKVYYWYDVDKTEVLKTFILSNVPLCTVLISIYEMADCLL